MREMIPGISVIVPVYNRERLIVEALESVLRQTVVSGRAEAGPRGAGSAPAEEAVPNEAGRRVTPPLLEIIVVDDGSTDGTREAVRAVQARWAAEELAAPFQAPADEAGTPGQTPRPAIRLRELSHTGYPGLVRNRGVEWARGRLVAFLDADDLWLPEKLERQGELHARFGYEVSHTRELWERRDGPGGEPRVVSQRSHRHRRRGFVFDESLVKCVLGPSTLMMERTTYERTGGFREDLEIAEDYEYFLRLTDHVPVGYLEDALTVKRAGWGDQLSEKYGHIELFRLEALRSLVERRYWGARPELEQAARRELARKCAIYSRGARKRGRHNEAARYEELAEAYERESARS